MSVRENRDEKDTFGKMEERIGTIAVVACTRHALQSEHERNTAEKTLLEKENKSTKTKNILLEKKEQINGDEKETFATKQTDQGRRKNCLSEKGTICLCAIIADHALSPGRCVPPRYSFKALGLPGWTMTKRSTSPV